MIMRGTTPRALSWRGLLAVVGLGALMLPLLPAWARAQTPAGAETVKLEIGRLGDGFVILKAAEVSPEEADKAKAELKELEVQLAQKQADLGALAAKVAAARAKVAQGDGALKGRIIVEAAPDANYKALQDVLQQIQKAQPAAAPPEVIVIDQATGKIIMKMQGANTAPTPAPAVRRITQPETTPAWVPMTPVVTFDGRRWILPSETTPALPGNNQSGVPTPRAPSDADRRIDELEQKLKSILDEVEKLRHERKPSTPEAGKEQGLHSYGPAPLAVIPYVARLLTNTAPAQEQAKALEAARAALQAQQEEVRAKLAAEKTAEVDRQAAEDRIKQLEELLKQKEKASEQAPKKPASKGSDEASSAFTSADHSFNEGKYENALKLYEQISERNPKDEIGVMALGGCVRCLAAMGRKEEMNKRRQEIKARLDVLSAEVRPLWEKWLEASRLDVSGPDNEK